MSVCYMASNVISPVQWWDSFFQFVACPWK